jgi:hypothetical protein
MNSVINKKSIYLFGSIFTCFFLILAFSLNSDFEEHHIYKNYAKSMVLDLDYNILNQVDKGFGWLLTKNYVHPSQHSVIQTPSLLFLELINTKLSSLFPTNSVKEFVVSGILLNVFSLVFGFIFCRKTLKLLNLGITNLQCIFLVFSTAILYYSFFSLTVIEIFAFPLSSFVLYQIFQLTEGDREQFRPVIMGLASGLLLVSKVSYVFLFILSLYVIIFSDLKEKKSNIIKYIIALMSILIPSICNDFVQYGEVVFLSSSFSSIMLDISVYNFINTLIYGYFGVGGLVYVNPIHLPAFFSFLIYFIREVFIQKKFVFRNLVLILWLGMGFFQTIFLPAFIVSDHYIGRLVLTCLPPIVLGFGIFISYFRNKKFLLSIIGIVLIIWQFFALFNFLTFYKKSHFAYASKKIANNIDEFVKTFLEHFSLSIDTLMDNYFYIVIVAIVSTFVVLAIRKCEDLDTFFGKYVMIISIFLAVFSLLNFLNSKNNSLKYFSVNENRFDRVIGNHASIYIFIYVMDGLKTLSINNQDVRMKKIINRKRKNYYDSLKGKTLKSTPEFDKALRDYDFDFGYFK